MREVRRRFGRLAGTLGISTVRFKLTLLATSVVAAVLVISAFGLVVVQRSLLTHGLDEALVQRADNIEVDVERGAFGDELPVEGDPEDSFLQLLGPQGRVVAASSNAEGLPAISGPLRSGMPDTIRTAEGVSIAAHQNLEFRILARGIDSGLQDRTLLVAKNLDDVTESVGILTSSLAISIPLVTLFLGVLVWWLTGRTLRPVESMRSEVAGIGGEELHRRVNEPGKHDEISRLARTMNAMLDRVEQATQKQRQFVADASHELRSPLTRIRAQLEVAIAHPDIADDAETLNSLLADATDLQKLVDDLLYLARAEFGASGPPQVPVDLDDLILDAARRLREHGRVRVDTSAVSAARALGDADQLARAIRNLASNAERHATSSVAFALREDDGQVELVVADDGHGIPPEYRTTVFERFTRLDEARSRDAGGFGLGLAIVHDIVTRHQGTIGIAPTNGGGARFVMRLPRVD